jgi:hypothetical protein
MVATTVGGSFSARAVVNDHCTGALMKFPAWSFTPVVTVAV